jgi:hypothetical protein
LAVSTRIEASSPLSIGSQEVPHGPRLVKRAPIVGFSTSFQAPAPAQKPDPQADFLKFDVGSVSATSHPPCFCRVAAHFYTYKPGRDLKYRHIPIAHLATREIYRRIDAKQPGHLG